MPLSLLRLAADIVQIAGDLIEIKAPRKLSQVKL